MQAAFPEYSEAPYARGAVRSASARVGWGPGDAKSSLRALVRMALIGLVATAASLGIAETPVPGSTDHAVLSPRAVAPEPLEVAATLEDGGATALAQSDLSTLECKLFADAADSRLDEHSLLVAALVASGVDSPEVLAHYQERLDEYVAALKELRPQMEGGREEAEAVFDFLHKRILRGGYRIECTDLRIALDEGRFNCVSGSVLFQCLAERRGLDVRGLEMPGHAMSRVHTRDGPLDIETTCAAWFRLMDDPKRQAQSVRETLGTLPGSANAVAREVSSVGLVAMVYYNRGVDLLARGRFAEAATANAKALHLDPVNQTARGNLLATVNNWAIALGQAGRLDEAMAILQAGLTLEPRYEPFALNYAHIHQQRRKQLRKEAESPAVARGTENLP